MKNLNEEVYVNRNGLCNPDDVEKIPEDLIKLCEGWIKKFAISRKTINTNHTSYYFKHKVEKYSDTYICNGAFIQAAINLGYEIKDDNSLNALFNINVKTWDKYLQIIKSVEHFGKDVNDKHLDLHILFEPYFIKLAGGCENIKYDKEKRVIKFNYNIIPDKRLFKIMKICKKMKYKLRLKGCGDAIEFELTSPNAIQCEQLLFEIEK